MIAESHVLKRQVQTGDPDIDSFWNSFNPTPATGNQRPTTGNQRPTVPTQRPTTQSPQLRRCIQNCLTTTEYNPVCGSDGVQYNNIGRLNCARNCGVSKYFRSESLNGFVKFIVFFRCFCCYQSRL